MLDQNTRLEKEYQQMMLLASFVSTFQIANELNIIDEFMDTQTKFGSSN